MYIYGSGFTSNSQVEWQNGGQSGTIPADRTTYYSSSKLRVKFRTTLNGYGTWQFRVRNGNKTSSWKSFTVEAPTLSNQPPVIDSFDANPKQGDKPLKVTFTCTAHDPDGNIASYKWDFDGDGNIDQETSTGIVTHTYTAYGTYAATVTVFDGRGEPQKSQPLTVIIMSEQPPLACPATLSFDEGIIIPDNELRFVDIPISVIQGFLEDKGSVLADIDPEQYPLDPAIRERGNKTWSEYIDSVTSWNLDELKDNKPTKYKYSPAQIIYLAAKENNVNPIILLAFLQKEQGLIESLKSEDHLLLILNRAVGYRMTENGDDPKYYGFLAQLTGLSWEIDKDIKTFTGPYYSNKLDVYVKTGFAHFYYNYTPHLDTAKTLFDIYNDYRSYFISKGYSPCSSSSMAKEVPKSPYYPYSNKDWWQYQFAGYPDFSNHNCGPACTAMVINYLNGNPVSTQYGSFSDKNFPQVHCAARGNYIGKKYGGKVVGGYSPSDWSNPGAITEQIQKVLEYEGIQIHLITGYDCYNDGTGITNLQSAIDQGKVCIVRVVLHEYQVGSPDSPEWNAENWKKWMADHPNWESLTHWVVVYGYDDNSIYLNDPGYRNGKGYRSPKDRFADAMWDTSELSTIIVCDTQVPTLNQALKIDSFTANPLSGAAPLKVTFACQAHDPDGNITSYKWDFDGDGTPDQETSTGTVTYTYDKAGVYIATVTVLDNKGAVQKSDSLTITVNLPKGDLNADGKIDLKDAIIALKGTVGLPVNQKIYPEAEPTGDGKIGLDDVIFILRKMAQE